MKNEFTTKFTSAIKFHNAIKKQEQDGLFCQKKVIKIKGIKYFAVTFMVENVFAINKDAKVRFETYILIN